jgi:hypothetical protein
MITRVIVVFVNKNQKRRRSAMKKSQNNEGAEWEPAKLLPGRDYVTVAGDHHELVLATENPDETIIGGFHTLIADVGLIPGHPLSGYLAGDPLPASFWTQNHRAQCDRNDGLVYDPKYGIWVSIYLAMDDNRQILNLSFDQFEEYGKERGIRLITSDEFSSAAEGSNEMTNIQNSRRPDTSGGHVDQMGRRMISNIGCEDCAGFLWQYLSTPHPVYSDYQLIAGGDWGIAAIAGSRCRSASYYRWDTYTGIGARFVSEPRKPAATERKDDGA